ncbi:hypothetical protein C8R44DRAFT_977870 [Mycena epipterygia]|nr:hypothetical protein C8R44DRAFT_977870 [Mycena epipterygia]
MGGETTHNLGDPDVAGTTGLLEILQVSDEVQRAIDEQEDVFEPGDDSPRCVSCSRSQAELLSGVVLKHCKACGLATYCGKECQRLDWPSHKLFCKFQEKEEVDSSTMGPRAEGEDNDAEEERTYPPIHYSVRHALRRNTGEECQRLDWKFHKVMCHTNRIAKEQKATELDYPKMYDDLRKFCKTFQLELVDAAAYCLKLPMHSTAWKTHIFEVSLRYLPWGKNAVNRFKVSLYGARKIADLNEPELERMIAAAATLHEPDSIILHIVVRAEPYAAKKKHVCMLQDIPIDPDFGSWNSNWESDFLEGIKLVQAGAPKLR